MMIAKFFKVSAVASVALIGQQLSAIGAAPHYTIDDLTDNITIKNNVTGAIIGPCAEPAPCFIPSPPDFLSPGADKVVYTIFETVLGGEISDQFIATYPLVGSTENIFEFISDPSSFDPAGGKEFNSVESDNPDGITLNITGLGSVLILSDLPQTAGEVPEPSTWAMMLLGFAGLGYVGYRRARRSHTAFAHARKLIARPTSTWYGRAAAAKRLK
jgi:hypothetical protein